MDRIFEELKTVASQKGWNVEGCPTGEIDLISPCRRFFKNFDHTFESAACTLALEWLKSQADISLKSVSGLYQEKKSRRKNNGKSGKQDGKTRRQRD
ncbi:MAG: hypothetical protein ACRCT1_06100 [Microcoleaceae cyanobacterium]